MSGERNRFSRSKSPKARWHSQPDELVDEIAITGTALAAATASSPSSTSRSPNNTDDAEKLATAPISNATPSDASAPAAKSATTQRKRKWITNESAAAVIAKKAPIVTISSDTLKSYLPTNPNENLSKQMSESGEEEMKRRASENQVVDSGSLLNKQSSRTVILEVSPPGRSHDCINC